MWRTPTNASQASPPAVQGQKWIFNPREDYDVTLNKMREEFNQKWENNKPSPKTNLQGYEELLVLGAGSFGQKLVRHKESSRYYAVKTMTKSEIVRLKKVHHILSEKRVIQAINFPTLIRLEFSSKDHLNLYLGLPVVSGGELYTYHRKVKKFSEKQSRFYAMQIALGLEYLHHLKILYRDLKLENVLIDTNGYLKITDFGFAKRIEHRTSTLCGTPEYLPPEIITSTPYGTCADWWSFGVIVYEMVAGRTPFYDPDFDVMEMYQRICECNYKIPVYFSANLSDLITNLLQVDVTKRLGSHGFSCKDIKNHPWFHQHDWLSILNQEINAPFVPTISNAEDTTYFDTKRLRQPERRATDPKRFSDVFADF